MPDVRWAPAWQRIWMVVVLCGWAPAVAWGAKAPGLGNPGKLVRLEVLQPESLVLRGKDARAQLVVLGHYDSGQMRDLTRKVAYQVSPSGVVQVDSTGFVTPVGNGTATITASYQGHRAEAPIRVEHFDRPVPINFPNQIVPIFTKLGCNMGACHGKSTGQNGFKLSLLGFYPQEDYEYLVKEGRGRRLFPAAPQRSLLLLKATNRMAHGGGLRIEPGSYEYQLLYNWIAQGMPYGNPDDPVVQRIAVFPQRMALPLHGQQQLQVLAYYSDGTVQDVTRMAQYEPNMPEMAEVSKTGLVRVFDLTGEVGVMVRYQGHVTVFRAAVPLGIQVKEFPPARNFVDRLVFAKLKELGIPPSPVCDDYTFVRRVTLDICGRLPTPEEVRQFVADTDPHKRDKLIDRLLNSPDYADYFANKWASILRVRTVRRAEGMRGTYLFHAWIRQSLLENKPYDQFVREIVAASGDVRNHPPVAWFRELTTPEAIIEDIAQLFLGQRIQCARCHHHPFERWSQKDYYGFAAFFTRLGRKDAADGTSSRVEPRIYHRRGVAQATNPRTRQRLRPTGLGGKPLDIPPEDDPRHYLVDWMVNPKNPYFAKSLVNRYWKHFFGRGIVEPEDDMRVTNPPSNPELLDALAEHFIRSGYDMKELIRTLCRSTVYQLSSEPNAYNETDKQNFSRYYAKRLPAEVLYDALAQATGVPSRLPRMPAGARAVQLPDMSLANYFLLVFGRPQGTSPCECERSYDANLAQTLHLLNSREIQDKVQRGHALRLARDRERSDREKVEELYLYTLNRPPKPKELQACLQYLEKHRDRPQEAYADILWALINTKEFLFNH